MRDPLSKDDAAMGSRRGLRALTVGAAGVVLGVFSLPGSAGASVATVSFAPEADTYVTAANPDTVLGTSSSFQVDRAPSKVAFLRFQVEGIGARPVVGARLRMYQTNASDVGGRVYSVSDDAWDEGMSWNTRPTVDGPQIGSFGAVSAGNFYESGLSPLTGFGDGEVTVAVDSTSSDDARWSSGGRHRQGGQREGPAPDPRGGVGHQVVDGLSQVAAPLNRLERAHLLLRPSAGWRCTESGACCRARTPRDRRTARLARSRRQLADAEHRLGSRWAPESRNTGPGMARVDRRRARLDRRRARLDRVRANQPHEGGPGLHAPHQRPRFAGGANRRPRGRRSTHRRWAHTSPTSRSRPPRAGACAASCCGHARPRTPSTRPCLAGSPTSTPTSPRSTTAP